VNSLKALIATGACAAFRLTRPLRSGTGFRALMYHSVGADVVGDVQGLYNISPSLFRAHMEALAQLHKARLAPLQMMDSEAGGIAVTFDDGYRNTLEVAAPVLSGLGIPFTAFVASGFVSSGDPLYLSPAGLVELASVPGATIGAHGYTHRRLTDCDDAELDSELTGSRAWLEDLLGRPVTSMSYPHGAADQRVRVAAAKAGFRIAACSRFGSHTRGEDPLMVARTDVWAQDNRSRFLAKLAGDWDWLGWRT
jgi:peptidoglycan/xylan/chitin deacetylase (PgdA/CDA1 family)